VRERDPAPGGGLRHHSGACRADVRRTSAARPSTLAAGAGAARSSGIARSFADGFHRPAPGPRSRSSESTTRSAWSASCDR
jgi:hypothetical protein